MPQKLVVLILFIFLCDTLYSGETGVDTFIGKQQRFVFQLYRHKRYFDTIAETRRLLAYKNMNAAERDDYNYFILTNYYFGKQYASVIARSATGKNSYHPRDIFLVSHASVKNGMPVDGLSLLGNLDYDTIAPGYRIDLFSYRNSILLKQHDYAAVIREIKKFKKIVPENSLITSYETYIKEYQHLSVKSPGLSVALSAVIPGSGQFYAGKYSDALISVLGVAGAAFGSYYLYNNGEKELSYAMGFFCVLFYTGNIYGAYNSAKDHNRRLYNRFSRTAQNRFLKQYDPEHYFTDRFKKEVNTR